MLKFKNLELEETHKFGFYPWSDFFKMQFLFASYSLSVLYSNSVCKARIDRLYDNRFGMYLTEVIQCLLVIRGGGGWN